MLKVKLSNFLAVAGLNNNSNFAALILFEKEDDSTYFDWDAKMKSRNIYSVTPPNVLAAIESSSQKQKALKSKKIVKKNTENQAN
jgi:hypothetical protein